MILAAFYSSPKKHEIIFLSKIKSSKKARTSSDFLYGAKPKKLFHGIKLKTIRAACRRHLSGCSINLNVFAGIYYIRQNIKTL
jgi:hypothetical protein